MSKTYEKQLIYDIESIKSGLSFCGHDTEFCQLVWALKGKIKEYYPMNEVPKEIVDSLQRLEERFKIAEEQLMISVDVIVHTIKKELGIEC